MARSVKPKKEKKAKEKLELKDHPSLAEVGGKLRLRVFEDFFVEGYLPKWVKFKAEWAKVREELGISRAYTDKEIEAKVNGLKDKTDAEKATILARAKALIEMDRAIQDDRWNIQGKHEREVQQSVLKTARLYRGLSWVDKLKAKLFGPKVIPVDIAMDELMEHIELTSTKDMESKLIKLKETEANMRAAGQIEKADFIKSMRTIIVEEAAVVAAGFEKFVSEDAMIKVLKKSERGMTVDFLRYYEDEIPNDVVQKKIAVDGLMVFDNYVVVHYSDAIRQAEKVKKETSKKEEKKARELRRDPILFGIIKNSRKLYYIADWVTDTDDLTLEKLENELGVTCGSLVDGSATTGHDTDSVHVAERDDDAEDLRRLGSVVQRITQRGDNAYTHMTYSSQPTTYDIFMNS